MTNPHQVTVDVVAPLVVLLAELDPRVVHSLPWPGVALAYGILENV